MLRIIKLGNLIYENIEAKTIDENGNEIWNIPNTAPELQKAFSDTLVWLESQRLKDLSSLYSYNGLADIDFYARRKDKEAKSLLDWYEAYDDAIWNWIDNELPKITDLEQLLKLDMKQIEEQIFQQSIEASPLPENEE